MLSWLKSVRLIRNCIRPPLPPDELVRIPFEEKSITADIYRPSSKNVPGILLCHGLTEKGKDEPRIQQFACGLRAAGYFVLVPTFSDAERLRATPSMINEMEASLLFLSSIDNVDSHRLGLFGISFGGTAGLLASTRGSVAEKLSWVGTIGAYAYLENILEYATSGRYPKDGSTYSVPPASFLSKLHEQNIIDPSLSLNTKLRFPSHVRFLLFHSRTDYVVPYPEMNEIRKLIEQCEAQVNTYDLSLGEHAKITGALLSSLSTLRAARAMVRAGRLKY